MNEYGRAVTEDELRLEYLIEKQEVAGLDKAERYELQELLNEETA